MSSLANTLYARLLQSREINRQRKLEEERFDREFVDRSMQRNLEESRLTERAKELEFQRHMKVAEAEARAASLSGRGMAPGGYHNPAVAEAARVAHAGGMVDKEKQDYDRFKDEADWRTKARGQDLDYRASMFGHLGGVEKSGYARLTPEGRGSYLPALSNLSKPLPSFDGPLTERVPNDEIQARRQPKAVSDAERTKHFDKFESYLNQAAAGKEEWAAFAKAGELRRLGMELREYAALGFNLGDAMADLKKRKGWTETSLIDEAARLMGNADAPALGVTGPRPATPSALNDLD